MVATQKKGNINFHQIQMVELVSAQHHDIFCAEKYRPHNYGYDLRFKTDEMGLLVCTVHGYQKAVVTKFLTKVVLYLKLYVLLSVRPGGRKF